MAIHARSNLYPGVNAHLNSFLQLDGGDWETFHTKHVNVMQEHLDSVLPSRYYTLIEKSLQLTAVSPGFAPVQRTRPDIAIMERSSGQAAQPAHGDAPVATLPLQQLLNDDEFDYLAVVIYAADGGHMPGRPVTRIEVLSPSNKPPRGDYQQYHVRRLRTLRSGIALVEIDYLHQTPPANPLVASYPDGDEGALPYYIAISLPHPTPTQGVVHIYGAGVDTRLPRIPIPLAEAEAVLVDMSTVYNMTFTRMRAFELVVDYAQDPPNFDRYRPADRDKIAALLAEIRRAPPADVR